MSSRRTFLKSGLNAGVGVYAAGAVAIRSFGAPLEARYYPEGPYYKVIFDERFEEARAFGARSAQRPIPIAAIRGDITRLFYDDLDVRWKKGPVLLAGYTTQASLLCLDLLARDRGMRLIHRAENPGVDAALAVLDGEAPHHRSKSSGDPSTLVFWIIAPKARPLT